MAEVRFTPRPDFASYSSYLGSNVKLVGKIVNCNGSTAILSTCDGGEIQINLQSDSKCLQAGEVAVEVLGRVEQDSSVTELVTDLLPGTYTPQIYASVVRIMKEYPALYGP